MREEQLVTSLDDSSDASSATPQQKSNLFDVLDIDAEPVAEPAEPAEPAVKPVKPVKPVKKRKKRKKRKEEDIDQVVNEINEKYGHLDVTQQTKDEQSPCEGLQQGIAIDTRKLDWNAELKRSFGARVADEEVRVRRQKQQRTHLAALRDNWPPISKSGLAMVLLRTVTEASGASVYHFTFVHSPLYQDSQFEFLQCVNSHDPANIQSLLRRTPYHIDSLVQMSEVAKHRNDFTLAAELIERALYAFECAFHSLFNLATGACRLSYDRVENRPFFLCLYRHIDYLSRKGCWRTALEVQKLLYSLDPETDPMCSLLNIDYLALKANEFLFYKTFWVQRRVLLQSPNAAFSVALSEWEMETKQKQSHHAQSTHLLIDAIRKYPALLHRLYDAIGVTDSRVSSHPSFTSHNSVVLDALIDYYVARANSVWKVPETTAWLRQTVDKVIVDYSSSANDSFGSSLPLNLQRVLYLSDIQSLSARLPPETVAAGIVSYDPIPPTTSIASEYDVMRSDLQSSRRLGNITDLSSLVRMVLPFLGLANNQPDNLAGRVANEIQLRRQGGGRMLNPDQEAVAAADLIENVLPANQLPVDQNIGDHLTDTEDEEVSPFESESEDDADSTSQTFASRLFNWFTGNRGNPDASEDEQ